LSEDSGFFIKKLNWKPWISVKTWWWEYEKELNKKEFLKLLKEKIETLDDTSSYFLTSLSIAFPSWEVYSILHKEEWYIDKNKFWNISTSWYPLSSVFIANWRWKTWSEMTNEEKKKWEQKFIDRINKFLYKIY
jgi:inosine/xanthosine triphosphate pyrophosphatase family protein